VPHALKKNSSKISSQTPKIKAVVNEDQEPSSDGSEVVLEVDYNPPLQHSQQMQAYNSKGGSKDNMFEVDIEDFQKLEARVNFYEEMVRKDKQERASQINALVASKGVELSA
jgi:hypothetical protein